MDDRLGNLGFQKEKTQLSEMALNLRVTLQVF